MGRPKSTEKNLPLASSNVPPAGNGTDPAPIPRKRGRPRKVPKEENGTEVHKTDAVAADDKHTPLLEAAVKRGRKKKSDEPVEFSLMEVNGVANGGDSHELVKPQVVKREGNRRKGEPRRAAGVAGK